MTILVSGASGFLGKKLITELSNNSETVIAIYKSQPNTNLLDLPNIQWIKSDLSSSNNILNTLEKIDTVVHLAGATLGAGSKEDIFFESNEVATFNLLNQLSGKCSNFIYASSQVIYGDICNLKVKENFPTDTSESAYACSKVNCENWFKWFQKKSKGSYISLRFCGFIDGGGLIDYIIKNAIENNKIELFSKGLIVRDYIPSRDGINAITNSIKNIKNYKNKYLPINIGSGQLLSAFSIADLIIKTLDSKSKIVLLDRNGPQRDFGLDISQAQEIINYLPSKLEDEICKYALKIKDTYE